MSDLAPINILTGLLGTGKTLRALELGHELSAEKTVYVIGVEGFRGTWATVKQPEELQKWLEWAEPNSVIILDECHKHLPQRTKDKAPEWITEMAETRRRGVQWILVTQEPMSMDAFVRRRAGRHEHFEAKGQNRSQRYTWPRHRNTEDMDARRDAEKKLWQLPKERFGDYESATVHDRRPVRPGWKVYAGFAIFAALPMAGAWAVWNVFYALGSDDDQETVSEGHESTSVAGSFGLGNSLMPGAGQERTELRWWHIDDDLDRQQARVADLEHYQRMREPRVASQPWSAPIHDDRTPDLPEPYACLSSADRCQCYTEQAVRVEMPDDQCRYKARNGVHDPYASQRPQSDNNQMMGAGQRAPENENRSGAEPGSSPIRNIPDWTARESGTRFW